MQGKEVKQILADHHVSFNRIASQLGITPQALYSRFNAATFRKEYLQQITAILGKDIFGLGEDKDNRQPVLDLHIDPGHGARLEDSKPVEFVQIPAFNGCIGLTAFGSALSSSYLPGDIIFVRPYSRLEEIDYGCAYVLVTHSDRLLKKVYPSERGEGYLRLTSDNPSVFPAYDLPFSAIIFFYKVVGLLRRSQL